MLEFLLLIGRSDCLALHRLVLAVFLDVRVVHVDIILDHLGMASLFSGQRYVPVVLVGFFQC